MFASIPRFLLPQRSSIWASRLSLPSPNLRLIRDASSKPSPKIIALKQAAKKPVGKPNDSKTLVLEKPSKFTPPSHPQRLNKASPQYPGPRLSAEEKTLQATKRYPNMMPRPGTFMHWFLNNRSIHLYITFGVLGSVAGWAFFLSYKNSPFGNMMPQLSDVFWDPITFWSTLTQVVKLEGERRSEETKERRNRTLNDITKRMEYRNAHGLETKGWSVRTNDDSLDSALDLQDPTASVPVESRETGAEESHRAVQQEHQPGRGKPKRWLGIW